MFGLLLLRQSASEFLSDGTWRSLGYKKKNTKLFKTHIKIVQFLKVIFTISISSLLAKQREINLRGIYYRLGSDKTLDNSFITD